jgi:hypothetical protein
MYSLLVRKGGIIAFHDIIPDYYTKYVIKRGSWQARFINFGMKIENKMDLV